MMAVFVDAGMGGTVPVSRQRVQKDGTSEVLAVQQANVH